MTEDWEDKCLDLERTIQGLKSWIALESWVRKSRASQHEHIIEQIKQRKELQAQLATLQAQLRQVEGERDAAQALVSERASMIGSLTAALRRAKVEVWREAATHVLTCMHAVDAANDFDARAAQIEEGE